MFVLFNDKYHCNIYCCNTNEKGNKYLLVLVEKNRKHRTDTEFFKKKKKLREKTIDEKCMYIIRWQNI